MVFSPHLSGAPMPTRGGGSNLGIGEAAAFISHFITMNPKQSLGELSLLLPPPRTLSGSILVWISSQCLRTGFLFASSEVMSPQIRLRAGGHLRPLVFSVVRKPFLPWKCPLPLLHTQQEGVQHMVDMSALFLFLFFCFLKSTDWKKVWNYWSRGPRRHIGPCRVVGGERKVNVSRSAVSDSLRPHGL